MKRMNVMIDETVLQEAHRITGEKNYSATINRALQELVRVNKVREGIRALSGTGWWEGNLEEMRRNRTLDEIRDAPIPPKRQRRKKDRDSR